MTYSTYYATPQVMREAMLRHLHNHEERAQRLSTILALPAPAPGYAVLPASELKQALDKLAKFHARKSTLPVLANVLIVARPGSLTLSATDLEKALTVKLECKGRPYFSVTTPLVTLQKMLAGVDCSISLTKEGYTLVIRKQGAGILRVNGMDAGEYPTIPQPMAQYYFSISSNVLGKEIERVARAAASDEARPIFTGILFQVGKDKLTMVAGDSYRLHVASAWLDMGGAGDVIMPAKMLTTLASILPKKPTTLHFWLSAERSQVSIRWQGHVVVSRLIDGSFPAWQRIMPNSSPDHYAVVDSKQLLDMVALVGKVVAEEANNIVSIGWKAGKVSQVVVFAESEEIGSQEEYCKADLDSQEKTQERFILCNYKYLVDALRCIKGYATLRFWDSSPLQGKLPKHCNKPFTVRPLETEEDFTALLMPMTESR